MATTSPETIRIYIDYSQKNDFFIIGAVAVFDSVLTTERIFELKATLLGDLHTSHLASMSDLEIKGFHYTSDHAEVKTRFVDLISDIPLHVELITSRQKDFAKPDIVNLQLKLINKFIMKFIKFSRPEVIVEQGPESKNLKESLAAYPKYSKLVTIGSKNEYPELAIIDYILGIYGDTYLKTVIKVENKSFPSNLTHLYNEIKHKIRSVLDLDKLYYHTRKNDVKLMLGGSKILGYELVPIVEHRLPLYLTPPFDRQMLLQERFDAITTLEALSSWVDIPVKILTEIHNKGIRKQDISIKYIPKRKGGLRRVYCMINPYIDEAQKIIDVALKKIQLILLTPNVHGFVTFKSTRTNALTHLGAKHILNLDIRNFFGSITSTQVNKLFLELGCNDLVADIFTKLTTYKGRLAQGFRTSPTLSNLVFKQIDTPLDEILRKNDIKYTRYADDITLSSQHPITVLGNVKEILWKFKFKLNEEKTRFQKRGKGLYVTGLSVEDLKMPRIPRRLKRRIRMTLYNAKKKLINEQGTDFRREVAEILGPMLGRIAYINGIEPQYASKLLKEYFVLRDMFKKKL